MSIYLIITHNLSYQIAAIILLYQFTTIPQAIMSYLWMFVCVGVLYVPMCVCKCVCAWCLSGSLCLIWLMEVVVEAELPWLQLQAALGFSLTYDNAPVTLIQKPCSTFVVDGCSRFFLSLFFPSPSCSMYISVCLSLLSQFPLRLCTLTYKHTQSNRCRLESHADSVPKLTTADGGYCMRVFSTPPPALLNATAAKVFNRICAH